MNITRNASQLGWHTNTQGSWTAVIDDINPSTQNISFSNGYTATVTNRKVFLTNSTRPTGTVTYEVEDVENTAYASELAAVGSAKDTLDIVTGEKTVKMGSYTFTGEETPTLWREATGYYSAGFPKALMPNMKTFGQNVLSNVLCSVLQTRSFTDLYNTTTPVSGIAGYGDSSWSVFVRVPNSIADNSTSLMTWLTGTTVYYELATPTSSETAPQSLSLSEGSNTASMTSTSTGDKPSFPMSYDGTDYTISTKSTRVYLKDVDGTVERVTGVTSFNVRGGRDNIMDLTRMFGSGLEPGTLDAFYSLFPAWRGYKLPYNEGSLLNFKGTGLKSVGFNQWDGTYSNSGMYLKADGTVGAGSSYGISDYLRAIPGQVYRLQTYQFGAICWYTYDKTYISGTSYTSNTSWKEESFTAPVNAYWLRFTIYVPSENETCLYFQWSGTRNGDYEPYWDYTRPIPTLTYFPDGMNGRGNVYDEINDRQAIRRFNKIHLDDYSWTHYDSQTWGYWEVPGSPFGAKHSSSNNYCDVIRIADKYNSLEGAYSAIGNDSQVGCVTIGTNGAVRINNGSTTEPPSGWLVYELATPVVTTFSEEISTTARISDYGTEECIPVNGYGPVTAPFRGIVLYQDDYARTITKLPENYQSQDSMNNLLTLLGPLLNGTITATFDSANQVYTYQFTPNA